MKNKRHSFTSHETNKSKYEKYEKKRISVRKQTSFQGRTFVFGGEITI